MGTNQMGEAARRKKLDPNFGKSTSSEWQAIKLNLPPMPDGTTRPGFAPDLGYWLYSLFNGEPVLAVVTEISSSTECRYKNKFSAITAKIRSAKFACPGKNSLYGNSFCATFEFDNRISFSRIYEALSSGVWLQPAPLSRYKGEYETVIPIHLDLDAYVPPEKLEYLKSEGEGVSTVTL